MKEECAIAIKREKDPKMYHPEFLCMDLIYIHLLLKEGYGLKDQNTLEVSKVNNKPQYKFRTFVISKHI